MKNTENLKFTIDAFKPDTIPMVRLAEYLGDLARFLGETERVHFSGLKEGSLVVVPAVELQAAAKVRVRLKQFRRGENPPDDMLKAFDSIDRRLRQDNATAYLADGHTQVISFPGRERQTEPDFMAFWQEDEVRGTVVSVGGRDATKHVQLLRNGVPVVGIVVDEAMAKELARLIFGPPISLTGRARWSRDVNGHWELKRFSASGYRILDDRNLSDAITAIKDIAPNGWDFDEESANLDFRD